MKTLEDLRVGAFCTCSGLYQSPSCPLHCDRLVPWKPVAIEEVTAPYPRRQPVYDGPKTLQEAAAQFAPPPFQLSDKDVERIAEAVVRLLRAGHGDDR